MRVRRLQQRARPFRYAGLWTIALCLFLAGPAPDRGVVQLWVGMAFCLSWPRLADRLGRHAGQVDRSRERRRRPPAGARSAAREMVAYVAECALVSAVLAWSTPPLLAGFATVLCLVSGATALAGWRLTVPTVVAVVGGSAAGAALAPGQPLFAAAATDAAALALLFGFCLALAHLSFRQAQRLDSHRILLARRSAQLERLNGRMQRYLPPSLRRRLQREPDLPCRWERRWLTVVFVDLVGFTELAERLEAEPLARILDDYLGALVPAVEAHGGEVCKVLGDGVLALFGAAGRIEVGEGAAGDDRRAAVAGALRLCRDTAPLLEALAERWRARGEPLRLRVRIGIASGFCTLGDRGAADRLDFTLVGSPVNLASRLQALADTGGALMDSASAALAGRPADSAQPMSVRGFGELPVFALPGEPGVGAGAQVDSSGPSAIVPAPPGRPRAVDVPQPG